MYIVKMLEK